jgi:transaldolase/glucose-6-phosphate isomerase
VDLKELYPKFGQSIWLDYIRRHLITSGGLARLVADEGLRGVTSNPTIFQNAIAGSTDYESTIHGLATASGISAGAIYERIVVEDIQAAADILRPVYDASAGVDGFVSLEVSPTLAHDSAGTMNEARRLWAAVDRANLMVKVPATPQGIAAITPLISEGININVTLLFSRAVWRQVLEAYMRGLELRAEQGGDLTKVSSVASVFVSRIDAAINPLLEAPLPAGREADQAAQHELVNKVAIANAKLIYRDWQKVHSGARWLDLVQRGAHAQRLLWASTGTKDPRLSALAYVEALIGPDTVDTMPPATLDALRDHGQAADRLAEDPEESERIIAALANTGISLEEVTDRLREEGVRKFAASFEAVMATIEQKRAGALLPGIDRTNYHLPPALLDAVRASLQDWRSNDKVRRLWARDASLWSGHDEAHWLDWLEVAEEGYRTIDRGLGEFAAAIKGEFEHAVVLGMGGSSLCPDVLARTFGKQEGYPELLVLDSTDPAQISAMERRIALEKTLFIVSSKSGSTLEPNVLNDYFYERVCSTVGDAQAGKHFIAVTDPGSALNRVAESRAYRHIFAGVPGIGGRYSALSNFGMVPAAVMGIDLDDFLERTEQMVEACSAYVPAEQNPGVVLGTILGTFAARGRDKLTLIASPAIANLGAWLEQLVAESTGKQGRRAIIPIDREVPALTDVYGDDRLFVYLRLDSQPDLAQDAAVDALENAGHPVARIALADVRDLGQEFFRWEIATAVAGSILGVNPFDQPDVELSKIEARKLTDAYEQTGALPEEIPFYQEDGVLLFADPKIQFALEHVSAVPSLAGYLKALLGSAKPGDYFAVLAYLEQNPEHDRVLQEIRHIVRDRQRIATCEEFGPRFLHSTGQAYKGGANNGMFLQLTCDDPVDLPVPGRHFTFGVVKAAQARGDLAVLAQRDRRALRVHLGPDVDRGLMKVLHAVDAATAPRVQAAE